MNHHNQVPSKINGDTSMTSLARRLVVQEVVAATWLDRWQVRVLKVDAWREIWGRVFFSTMRLGWCSFFLREIRMWTYMARLICWTCSCGVMKHKVTSTKNLTREWPILRPWVLVTCQDVWTLAVPTTQQRAAPAAGCNKTELFIPLRPYLFELLLLHWKILASKIISSNKQNTIEKLCTKARW
jgi:hypothetical protein